MNNDTIVQTAAIKLTEQALGRALYAVSVTFDGSAKQYTYLSDVLVEAGGKAEVVVNGQANIVTVASCELASNAVNKVRVVADKLKSLSAVYARIGCDPNVSSVLDRHTKRVNDRMAKLLLQELGL